MVILTVSQDDRLQAKNLLFKYRDQDLSLTDAGSAVLMRMNGIEQVAGFDRHFSVLGFELL